MTAGVAGACSTLTGDCFSSDLTSFLPPCRLLLKLSIVRMISFILFFFVRFNSRKYHYGRTAWKARYKLLKKYKGSQEEAMQDPTWPVPFSTVLDRERDVLIAKYDGDLDAAKEDPEWPDEAEEEEEEAGGHQ